MASAYSESLQCKVALTAEPPSAGVHGQTPPWKVTGLCTMKLDAFSYFAGPKEAANLPHSQHLAVIK